MPMLAAGGFPFIGFGMPMMAMGIPHAGWIVVSGCRRPLRRYLVLGPRRPRRLHAEDPRGEPDPRRHPGRLDPGPPIARPSPTLILTMSQDARPSRPDAHGDRPCESSHHVCSSRLPTACSSGP
jgi:hypothetical protein